MSERKLSRNAFFSDFGSSGRESLRGRLMLAEKKISQERFVQYVTRGSRLLSALVSTDLIGVDRQLADGFGQSAVVRVTSDPAGHRRERRRMKLDEKVPQEFMIEARFPLSREYTDRTPLGFAGIDTVLAAINLSGTFTSQPEADTVDDVESFTPSRVQTELAVYEETTGATAAVTIAAFSEAWLRPEAGETGFNLHHDYSERGEVITIDRAAHLSAEGVADFSHQFYDPLIELYEVAAETAQLDVPRL